MELPSKPLKILTINGGGLQAISSLLILDELLSTIAKSNKVHHRKPRPCDVFDTIAGIGTGGWLALLLGRFHLDISACLSEWYKIIECIVPRSKKEKKQMGVQKHCYFNPKYLIAQVENLTKTYGTGEYLFEEHNEMLVRTRHVLVAAQRADSSDYNLFRTYAVRKWVTQPVEGPKNPEQYRISNAFCATGAARFFTPVWEEEMESSGRKLFSDTKFPQPHNITELALGEMWNLYGGQIPLSVIVNIGPGIPSTADVMQIARSFSWGLNLGSRTPSIKSENSNTSNASSQESKSSDSGDKKSQSLPALAKVRRSGTHEPIFARTFTRRTTFASVRSKESEEKLRAMETNIEEELKTTLNQHYEGGAKLYHRLAPDQAPKGTTMNDSTAAGEVQKETEKYMEKQQVRIRIDEIAGIKDLAPQSAEVQVVF